jgi:hypothetical protein
LNASQQSAILAETLTTNDVVANQSSPSPVDVFGDFATELGQNRDTPDSAVERTQSIADHAGHDAATTAPAKAIAPELWADCLPFAAMIDRLPQASSGVELSVRPPENTEKKRRKAPEERGLPSDKALCDLAGSYLKDQIKLWPEKARSSELPKITKRNLARMARDSKRRFLGSLAIVVDEDAELGAAYVRFSDDNSSVRSLNQQLHLVLEKARQNDHFIPWQLVFGDAAVTGTTSDRRGYMMTKAAIEQHKCIKVLYIDEIGRASRDTVEAMQLGQLIDRLSKRMITVSDGFDSASPMSKLILSIFASLQEWFVVQLRAKVNRGMADTFDSARTLDCQASAIS